jgi:antitoxin component YwqK of YwqJK toxin-antitoxin module
MFRNTRMRIYITLIILLFATIIFAQNDGLNKTDGNGIRIGKWLIYLDAELKTVSVADSSTYYKVINYVSGRPIGYVNFYYNSGKLYFQTPVKSIDPDVYSDGEIKYFAQNGDVLRILTYLNGSLNGPADYFFPDGKPQFHGSYTDNKRTGVWKQWDRDGQYGIGGYDNDVSEGKWTFYYADGSLKAEGKFRRGKQTGIWTEYRDNGDIAEGNYAEGIPDGTWVCRYKNDKPCFYGSYRLGKKNGFWKEWDLLGQLRQGNYIDDIQDGIWSFFNSQGNKVTEGTYLNGNQDGEWRKYDSVGNIIETKLYKDGAEVKIDEIQTN